MTDQTHAPETTTQGLITRDGSSQEDLKRPLTYEVVQAPDCVYIEFRHPVEGYTLASVHIEWDADCGKPVLRLWDGVLGTGNDPRLEEEITFEDQTEKNT